MRTWEQEKTYCAARAKALSEQMEAAITANDKERFVSAYQTAARYMNKRQRMAYYYKFLERRLRSIKGDEKDG